jgi:hypothetical protein
MMVGNFMDLALSGPPALGAEAGEVEWGPIVIGLFVLLVLLACCARGVIQTFRRNWILALVLLLFLFPAWMIWAFVEIFLPRPQGGGAEIVVTHRGIPPVQIYQQGPPAQVVSQRSTPPRLPQDRS